MNITFPVFKKILPLFYQYAFYFSGLPLSPALQLLVALRYMATGNYQSSIGDCSDMSQPSVCKCVRNVSSAIAQLASQYIKFPYPGKEEEIMQYFLSVAQMPGVIDCVDGTHIPIRNPEVPNTKLYRCRKNQFSMNVMAVCDAQVKFTNLIANWPGSAHDSRIFRMSKQCQSLQAGQYRGFLLEDSAYALRPYLLTPFLRPSSDKERRYNRAHMKTRNLEEKVCRA